MCYTNVIINSLLHGHSNWTGELPRLQRDRKIEFEAGVPRATSILLEIPQRATTVPAGRIAGGANRLSVLLTCVLIFVLFMVAGYAGLALQTKLVDEHKTGETKAVVGQVSGLVSLLLALVLGTLIGVSWGYFSAQRTNLENFSAQILRLDQALGQFGPETKPMRDQLKQGIEKAYEAIWGGGIGRSRDPDGRATPRQCARRSATIWQRFSPKRRRRRRRWRPPTNTPACSNNRGS